MADSDYNRRNKHPRPLSESEKARLEEYSDDEYEYRHVQLPKNMLKAIPKDYHDPSKGTLKLLWEEEWRALGITQVRRKDILKLMQKLISGSQSLGWEHYEVHEPEPHILLFK
ncbi:Cyclin-dependent kinases regulatory subunit [Lachnellula suecica]|uniref:Cyclin-dependent kinases regulatory subunit n=1 Tax=Lachnellula suecica TaxID=602035 RepID=A0A8T9BYK4_9HELO|nr:Cyclin-dependent kinases regulatory subunit [Lachnellula suecica]